MANRMSDVAKKYCEANGLEFTHQIRTHYRDDGSPHPAKVNVYPVEALDAAAKKLSLFELA